MPVIRKTRQRDAIHRVIREAERPLGPQEVLEYAQEHVHGLGIATVYRNLNALVEEGVLIPIDVPGDITRYEMAGKEHHHHFHCRQCGRVFEVDGCPGNIQALEPRGFRLENHEI